MQTAFEEAKRLNEGRTVFVGIEKAFYASGDGDHERTECRVTIFRPSGLCESFSGKTFDECLFQVKAYLSNETQPLPTNEEAGIERMGGR